MKTNSIQFRNALSFLSILAASLVLSACSILKAPEIKKGDEPIESVSKASKYRLIVSVADQKMVLMQGSAEIRTFLISTSMHGVSEVFNSGGTPRGRHVISEKIGDGVAIGTVFKDRLRTREIVPVDTPGRWPIATRILRLDGIENRNRFTNERLIYLHGSPAEYQLGTPASGGCIRMRSKEIVWLFDTVPVGTELVVYEENLAEAIKLAIEADRLFDERVLKAAGGELDSVQKLCLGHFNGTNGLFMNDRYTAHWCAKGAAMNDPVSVTVLGEVYESGKGVVVDLGQARQLYSRASDLGNSHAQYKLSKMLGEGIAGEKNEELSKELLARAATGGHPIARKQLLEITTSPSR